MSNAVRSQNPFELLGEDDDGAGVLPTPKPKPAAPKPAPAAAAAPAKKAPAANNRNNGARGNQRGPRDVQASEPGSTGEKIHEDRNQRSSRPSEAGRGGRGGKRGGAHFGAGAASHGGFDKKSGGHSDSHKRVESGWGAETGAAELADEESGAADAKADVQAATPGTATPAGEAAEAPKGEKKPERKPVEEEEEDNTQTYAEWASAKAAAAIEGVAQLAKRVVGDWEGEGEALQKKGDEAFFAAKEKARIAKEKAPKKVKETLQIDGKFSTPAGGSDRPTRGGRGGARGGAEGGRGGFKGDGPRGAGRGGPRGGAPRGGRGAAAAAPKKAPAADINDATAFPSLS